MKRLMTACALACAALLTLAACGSSTTPANESAAPAQPGKSPLPADFMWGVSSSAFQSEGGDVDCNWNRYNNLYTDQDRYGSSVDFRHRYKEDIALAKGLGANTYRIGINWGRVEPRKGEFDAVELAYYDDLVASLVAAGITPLITLDHWAYPGWVLEQNGWTNPQTVKDFVSFASAMAQRYHDDTHWWLTFNEAVFYLVSEVKERQLEPASAFLLAQVEPEAVLMMHHIVQAHRQTYDAIHALDPQAMVSSNIVWMGNSLTAPLLQAATDALFLDQVDDKMDYIAFDYYYGDVIAAILSGATWAADPAPSGLYDALMKLGKRFPELPLLISENGISTENGLPRPDGITREDALRDAVYWTQKAREDGAQVIGYMYWSLTDNFEWGSYTARFGLYTVDVLTDPTLTRKPTPAVPAYREIIRRNGVPADYQPVIGS